MNERRGAQYLVLFALLESLKILIGTGEFLGMIGLAAVIAGLEGAMRGSE